jgi:signal transduction histidine kinase/DNA-binding response OmpR family regulator
MIVGLAIDKLRLAVAQQRERRVAAESAVTLGTVLESVNSGVCVVDLEGTIRLTNRALAEQFGFSGRLAGLPQEQLFAEAQHRPREWDGFLARFQLFRDDPAHLETSEWEMATDPPRVIQRHSAPMRNLMGEVVGRVDVYTEVTETRRLYTQLLHTERLRAIGEMASGIAHDFNNLLASIVGQAELVSADTRPQVTRAAVETIRQAALDGARIVRNMQAYARGQADSTSTTTDLNDAVRAAVAMARPRFSGGALSGRKPIEIRLDLASSEELARAVIDPAEIREVLLNLLFNAVDAMPEGGDVEIATRAYGESSVAVLVRDTGQGIPETVLDRVFEPFFSTKGAGGSGLGLSVAYSIITRHAGDLTVESAVGAGTTFTITLPAAVGPRTGRALAEGRGRYTHSRASLAGKRILLVDDEPSVRGVVRQLLERSGASVETGESGRAGAEMLGTTDPPFDLVITDLDMPDGDGWHVSEAAKALAVPVPVIMLTGWAGEVSPDELGRRGVDLVLAKPCGRVELDMAIQSLLGPSNVADAPCLLLVEDDPTFAQSVLEVLQLYGYAVELVETGSAALERLDDRCQAVIADFSLPDMTGAELAARLSERTKPTPLLLLTGYATQADDPRFMTTGIAAVLPKPCSSRQLRATLARLTARPRAS